MQTILEKHTRKAQCYQLYLVFFNSFERILNVKPGKRDQFRPKRQSSNYYSYHSINMEEWQKRQQYRLFVRSVSGYRNAWMTKTIDTDITIILYYYIITSI